MRPLRHLPVISAIALTLAAAGGVQAQGLSMGEAVDEGGATIPDAQPPQVVAPSPQTPQLATPEMGTVAPDSLGAPADAANAAMPSIMGEPADNAVGLGTQQGGASMGQPVVNDSEFGAPIGGIVAIPDVAPIPTATATGIVKSYNESTLNLIMANRTVYRMPADFVDPGLKNGTKVKIQWYADGSARRATEVSIIKP